MYKKIIHNSSDLVYMELFLDPRTITATFHPEKGRVKKAST